MRSLNFVFIERLVGPEAQLFCGFNRRLERFDRALVVQVPANPHGAKSIEHAASNCVCSHSLPSRDQGDTSGRGGNKKEVLSPQFGRSTGPPQSLDVVPVSRVLPPPVLWSQSCEPPLRTRSDGVDGNGGLPSAEASMARLQQAVMMSQSAELGFVV